MLRNFHFRTHSSLWNIIQPAVEDPSEPLAMLQQASISHGFQYLSPAEVFHPQTSSSLWENIQPAVELQLEVPQSVPVAVRQANSSRRLQILSLLSRNVNRM